MLTPRVRRPSGLALTGVAAACAGVGVSLLWIALARPAPPPVPPTWAALAAGRSHPAGIGISGGVGNGTGTGGAGPGTAGIGTGQGPARPPGTSAAGLAGGLGRSRPVALSIPRIGVRTALIGLGLNPDGTVAVPPLGRTAPAGWYQGLASPGEIGPAVILGHVDSARDGPAVFYRLGELRPGDRVEVSRADGIQVRFAVDSVVLVPKTGFPTAAVYGRTDYPALRLVTCGGSFDAARHSYRDNVIVYAHAVPG